MGQRDPLKRHFTIDLGLKRTKWLKGPKSPGEMSGEDVTGLALKAFSFTKNLYKQGKNAVLNVGDIEAKTKEATNRKSLFAALPAKLFSHLDAAWCPRSPERTARGGVANPRAHASHPQHAGCPFGPRD